MKRLLVTPQMRGTGLGHALVKRRIDGARRMRFTRLGVDRITTTTAMQALFAKPGFQPIDRYAESASANSFPDLIPHMLFYERHL